MIAMPMPTRLCKIALNDLPSQHGSSVGAFAGLAEPLDCFSQAAFLAGRDALSQNFQQLSDICPAYDLSAGNVSLSPTYSLM